MHRARSSIVQLRRQCAGSPHPRLLRSTSESAHTRRVHSLTSIAISLCALVSVLFLAAAPAAFLRASVRGRVGGHDRARRRAERAAMRGTPALEAQHPLL
jgi:hypothetical protein